VLKKIDDININYIDYGNEDGKPLVFLHGWGQNIEMMKPLAEKLKKTNRIIIIDLPGFGQSEEPKRVYTIYDYVNVVNELLKELNVNNPSLIGHSFGGKISLLYASLNEVDKLVVMGSPYDVEIKTQSLKVKVLKSLKKIPILNKFENFAKKRLGSTDYKNASLMMRNVLTQHVNLSIVKELSKISCPTLIIWGTLDDAVKIEAAYRLEKLIKNAGLVIYQGNTHYAYLERLDQTSKVLRNFFGSEGVK
jgi:pimeloyl-ACP methyl ester carboxylesterase